jgi:hypothetical protein
MSRKIIVPYWLIGLAVFGIGLLLVGVGKASGQQVHSFSQVEGQAEVCIKRGNKIRCQTFPLQPWGLDTVEVVVTDTVYLDRVVTDTIYVELPPQVDTVYVELPPLPPDTVVVQLPAPPPDTVVVQLPAPPPDTVVVELPAPPPDTVVVEVPPDTVIVQLPAPPPDTVIVQLPAPPPDTVIVELPCDTVPAPEPVPVDSLVLLPDSLRFQFSVDPTTQDTSWVTVNPSDASLILPGREFQMSAVLWVADVPYVCVAEGTIEARISPDRSRACPISDGATLGPCETPQPLLQITSIEQCPSIWDVP